MCKGREEWLTAVTTRTIRKKFELKLAGAKILFGWPRDRRAERISPRETEIAAPTQIPRILTLDSAPLPVFSVWSQRSNISRTGQSKHPKRTKAIKARKNRERTEKLYHCWYLKSENGEAEHIMRRGPWSLR
jgi:hypothetical protein